MWIVLWTRIARSSPMPRSCRVSRLLIARARIPAPAKLRASPAGSRRRTPRPASAAPVASPASRAGGGQFSCRKMERCLRSTRVPSSAPQPWARFERSRIVTSAAAADVTMRDLSNRAHGWGAELGTRVERRHRSIFRQENWPPPARLAGLATGAALAGLGVRRRDPAGLALSLAGAGILARAISNLETRQLLGIGEDRAIRVHKTIHIDAPVESVFGFWADFSNYPRF